jgi:hypothetical protein
MRIFVISLLVLCGCSRQIAVDKGDCVFRFVPGSGDEIIRGDMVVKCGYEEIVKTEPLLTLKGFYCEIKEGDSKNERISRYQFPYLTFPEANIQILGWKGDSVKPEYKDIVVMDSDMNLVIVRRKS